MADPILFWDVDTQADFIYPDGKLYVPGAETILPNLKRLTGFAKERGIRIISSACAHRPDDAEFAQYPPHCLVGTPGQQKVPETRLPNTLTLPNRPVELPQDLADYPQIVLEKQQLDVFSNPNTEAVLKKLRPIREVILYGVVTEICVSYAARALIGRGYRFSIVTDAVRHLEEFKSRGFLEQIRNSGEKLIRTRELIGFLLRQPAT